MVLEKGASAIDQNGLIYTKENIGGLLQRRYIGKRYAVAAVGRKVLKKEPEMMTSDLKPRLIRYWIAVMRYVDEKNCCNI